ncbi:phage terminase small subunit [Eisenbergiella porci]|uniref:phage terminase small subunit n=1 Tax=Eisenbergiella TaxID=1432051 RepID=UPI0023F14602|nr:MULTISPECIES: phage terminase small subunit [Eisenbergiella]MCI6707419.1 phage terminase small subunit [Eisenbergiella massiliensis]MDY5529095.1 phage terminase small subunit [Eisenbergiella porci]
MPRKPDSRIEQAKVMFLDGMKLVEIASQLELPEGTVRRWKSTHNWDNERSEKKSERSKKRKGGQPGNRNAEGHGGTGPPRNHNAEKHGLFRKWLPEETFSIIQEMPKDPLDVLWDQIQIAYAAIIRAQHIMYVRDREDSTTTKIGQKDGDTVTEERWQVQQAWDKQGNFLKSQARAQGELRSLIKQYDEMLHRNWELATEEQKARIAVMKAKSQMGDEEETADDGFLDALNGIAAEDWTDEEG